MEGKKIEKVNSVDVDGYAKTFMEMDNSDYFQLKSLQVQKCKVDSRSLWERIKGKKKEDNDSAEVIITKEGISEKMGGLQTDFLLFTTEFNLKWGE